MAAPRAFRQLCEAAAKQIRRERAHWKVVCPTRVPLTTIPLYNLGGANLATGNLRTGYLINCQGWNPRENEPAHWLIAGGNPTVLNELLHPTIAVGQPAATVSRPRSIRLDGWPTRVYLVASGSQSIYADHVVVAWTNGGEGFQVSVHRFAGTAPATAQATAVAADMIKLQPR